MVRAGQNRFRLEIQSKATTQDTYGQNTGSYSTAATVWGNVTPLSGRELEEARAVNSLVSHQVSIRYGTTVLPKYRIVWGSRTFEVESVLNVGERKQELRCLCTERV